MEKFNLKKYLAESKLLKEGKFSVDVQSPYNAATEQSLFDEFIIETNPISMVEVDGIITDDKQDITIKFSNGDSIEYYYKSDGGFEAETTTELKITVDGKTTELGEDFVEDYIGSSGGSVIGDLGIMYKAFDN